MDFEKLSFIHFSNFVKYIYKFLRYYFLDVLFFLKLHLFETIIIAASKTAENVSKDVPKASSTLVKKKGNATSFKNSKLSDNSLNQSDISGGKSGRLPDFKDSRNKTPSKKNFEICLHKIKNKCNIK